MAIKATDYVWHNGQLIPWDDAKLHVMAHVVNYGSSLFEGIRCYQECQRPGHLPSAGPYAAPGPVFQNLPH